MRTIYFALLLFLALPAVSQEAFRGKITYQFRFSDEKPTEVVISYGANKMRIEAREKNEQGAILVDLDSLKVYQLDARDKSYEKVVELKKASWNSLQPRKLAGYATRPAVLPVSEIASKWGKSPHPPLVHIADDLYYPVPNGYFEAPGIPLIVNDHIVLAAEIKMADPFQASLSDSAAVQHILLEAVRVDKIPVDPGEFRIPADYTEKKHEDEVFPTDTSVTVTDTVWTAPDTTMYRPAPHKELPPKPQPPKPKKTSTQKGEAAKPKKTKQ